jgi:arginyl-tRNA synthetase
MVYVVASQQNLHFRQLFELLRRMGELEGQASLKVGQHCNCATVGHQWASDCIHVNFGLVKGMSTRRGTVVFLDDILDEAKVLALSCVFRSFNLIGCLMF